MNAVRYVFFFAAEVLYISSSGCDHNVGAALTVDVMDHGSHMIILKIHKRVV